LNLRDPHLKYSELECSSQCINFLNSSKCINFPKTWNEQVEPTESLGEESQSDTASYLLLHAILGPPDGLDIKNLRKKLQGCLPQERCRITSDSFRLLTWPRGVRTAALPRSPAPIARTGGPRGSSVISCPASPGQLAVLALLVMVQLCPLFTSRPIGKIPLELIMVPRSICDA